MDILENVNRLEDYLINESEMSLIDIQKISAYLTNIREEAISYSQCCKQLTDEDKEQLIHDGYWLNLQNLSGREDFEQAFMLGIKTGVDEVIEKLQG
ncbi:hypothetical protein [Thalassobellus suaedae]|uniref:Uncharacterized protein n=1 Tax=Thalassobellus suaedae TaxID=3074124 RepID=A0ABY9XVP2_9FLAO|nr:hypothetical protein RHP51_04835 [Flavobacteriaceae bacterium HL-DH14]